VLSFWNAHALEDPAWIKRVYQSVARVGDDSRVPVLEQIYAMQRNTEPEPEAFTVPLLDIKDLYWAIRGMDGPNARALRQRIRQDVGMPYLRGDENNPGRMIEE
jgi:hypothetical protein